MKTKSDLLHEDLISIKSEEFKCRICKDYLIKPSMTNCGHNFCELCLENWLISSTKCPDCEDDLRKGGIILNVNLDVMIKNEIRNGNEENYKNYMKREDEYKQFVKTKK